MSESFNTSPYDDFARIYSKYWGPGAVALEMPVVERLLLSKLAPNARLLDVCCGSGQIAAVLSARGYKVIGVDNSQMMLQYARQNARDAAFILADARTFSLPHTVDGALSTFESLNHITPLRDLTSVFHRVNTALKPGGLFYFDMNTAEGLQAKWKGDMKMSDDGRDYHVQMSYDPHTSVGKMHITVTVGGPTASSRTFDIIEYAYRRTDVKQALSAAGFADIQVYESQNDLQLDAPGVDYYLCQKPE